MVIQIRNDGEIPGLRINHTITGPSTYADNTYFLHLMNSKYSSNKLSIHQQTFPEEERYIRSKYRNIKTFHISTLCCNLYSYFILLYVITSYLIEIWYHRL